MNKYVTFRDTDGEQLNYYILQRDFPNYVGKISDVFIEKGLAVEQVQGYDLWIIFDGAIGGRYIPSYQNVFYEIKSVTYDMALWYLQNRVLTNPNRYKKFKSKNVSFSNQQPDSKG